MKFIQLYKISMSNQQFRKLVNSKPNVQFYNLEIKEDKRIFEIPKNELEILKEQEYEFSVVRSINQEWYFYILKKYYYIIIGVILFLIIIYGKTYFISNIVYSNNIVEMPEVTEFIDKQLNHIGPLRHLDESIADMNHELKNNYSEFEWISVSKVGTALLVDLTLANKWPTEEINNNAMGDLVAKKDGMVKRFLINQGVPLISENEVVLKGDTIVSGDLLYHHDGDDVYYISSNGIVFAEVWQEKEVVVNKEEVQKDYTGKIHTEHIFTIFKHDFKFNAFDNKYEEYEVKCDKQQINLFGFKITTFHKKCYFYEKDDIIRLYDLDKASLAAKSQAIKEVEEYFMHKDEYVIGIVEVNQIQGEENFVFTYFIKTYENIAVFKEFIENNEQALEE